MTYNDVCEFVSLGDQVVLGSGWRKVLTAAGS